ncbi:MAG: lytic transglycosylase domain-containing protein [Ottowia sp.]|nr:lytic transglycosylase domain-containing protein [Ottowia sp.]
MNFTRILPSLLLALALGCASAQDVPEADTPSITPEAALLDMKSAAQRRDSARLQALLPLVQGHPLQVWGEYWALKARLDDASPSEVRAFLQRWAGSYQEDRLRADWLLLAGKRSDWDEFAAHYPHFRMRDDANLRCWDIVRLLDAGSAPTGDAIAQFQRDWNAQRKESTACSTAASRLRAARLLADAAIWDKAQAAVQDGKPQLARSAAALIAPATGSELAAALNKPESWLTQRADAVVNNEIAALALLRLATREPQSAAALMRDGWAARLPAAQRALTWARIGKWSAMRHSAQPGIAAAAFAQVPAGTPLPDDLLAWRARSAVRRGDWADALAATRAMQNPGAGDGAWAYWRARAQLALMDDVDGALQQLQALATRGEGFYERLAQEDLGIPAPLNAEPAATIKQSAVWRDTYNHNGLRRALLAMMNGLRSEGTREWNYWTRLHTPGGMNDEQLYAAAQLACEHHIWDRCIAAAERIKGFSSAALRWPLAYQAEIQRAASDSGLPPALLHGLIHQESRYVPDAGSSAGARGLMQLMPATARSVARQLGLEGYSKALITDISTNLTLGSTYLRQQLERFDTSFPLATAAYNAGPGRPRDWRGSTTLEGAAWAESIPFTETRAYVKRVLHATLHYSGRLGGQATDLHALLGTITPPPPEPEPEPEPEPQPASEE